MQILHPFAGSIQQYNEQLSNPDSHRPGCCPQCQIKHPLTAHGFYTRTLIDTAFDGVIRVRRYLCNACQRTVSLLPEFILPYLRSSLTVIALFLYGLLPIVENAVAGLEGVPRGVREAAAGLGLSHWQQLRDVELPLAAPVILSGIRVSVTIAIGTATIGSTVGALTLGTPIFNGLVADKLPFVLEGAVLVALFAIFTDMLFARLDRWLRRDASGPVSGRNR